MRSLDNFTNPLPSPHLFFFFFFNDPATPEIYTLPLPAALPICPVLPVALGVRTTVVAGPAEAGVLEVVSTRDAQLTRLDLRDHRAAGWAAYVAGVWHELTAAGGRGERLAGARVAVAGDVPVGAGLASSPALTVATAKPLALLARAPLTPRQIAGVAFRAEHDHVGVRCGIMDQTIAALAQPSHALLIECASAEVRQIPFRGRLLLVDTGVRHELAAGAPNPRRREGEAAPPRVPRRAPPPPRAGGAARGPAPPP